jgi:DNA-binding transcriptional MerR regulator
VIAVTIAQVSEKYHITADTLRYYEKIGLIPPVNRNKNGVRDYTEENCRWVEFIKCMRCAGLQIEALVSYVKLFKEGDATAQERLQILLEQRQRLTERMQEMQEALEHLDDKIERYDVLQKAGCM